MSISKHALKEIFLKLSRPSDPWERVIMQDIKYMVFVTLPKY